MVVIHEVDGWTTIVFSQGTRVSLSQEDLELMRRLLGFRPRLTLKDEPEATLEERVEELEEHVENIEKRVMFLENYRDGNYTQKPYRG